MSDTHYEVLDVAPSATTAEIKTAYRRLLRTAHPDVGGSPSIFRTITEAHRVLVSEDLREDYDAALAAPTYAGAGPGGPAAHNAGAAGASFGQHRRPDASPASSWESAQDPATTVRLSPAPYAGSYKKVALIAAVAGGIWVAVVAATTAPAWPGAAVALALGLTGRWPKTRRAGLALLGAAVVALLALPLALGMGSAVAITVVPAAIAAMVMSLFASRHTRARQVERSYPVDAEMMATSYSYGRPGETTAARAVASHDPASNAVAELAVGAQLDRLLAIPGAKVFHGLVYPNYQKYGEDVDHAVLVGTTVVLVQSRAWGEGTYSFDRFGCVLRDGRPFPGCDVRFSDAVASYSKILGEDTMVAAVVAIYSSSGAVNVMAPESSGAITLCPASSIADTLGARLSGGTPVVERSLVSLLSSGVARARG